MVGPPECSVGVAKTHLVQARLRAKVGARVKARVAVAKTHRRERPSLEDMG